MKRYKVNKVKGVEACCNIDDDGVPYVLLRFSTPKGRPGLSLRLYGGQVSALEDVLRQSKEVMRFLKQDAEYRIIEDDDDL